MPRLVRGLNSLSHSRGGDLRRREDPVGVTFYHRLPYITRNIRDRHFLDARFLRRARNILQIRPFPTVEPIPDRRARDSLPVDNRLLLRGRERLAKSFFSLLFRRRSEL